MDQISSKDSQLYKLCKKLGERKHREALGLYLIEGEHLLIEALKSGVEPEFILLRNDGSFFALSERVTHVRQISIEPYLFDGLAQTETPQGVLAVVKKRVWNENTFFEIVENRNIAVLDRLQDPGNIGTIVRTAEAAGYGGLIAIKGTGDIYNPKTVRAATGSLFRLPVLFVDEARAALQMLKSHNKKTLATCAGGEKNYYDVNMTENVAVIIGNEGGGVSPIFIEGADIKVRIPMGGSVESLNVAVAAGILFYESLRR